MFFFLKMKRLILIIILETLLILNLLNIRFEKLLGNTVAQHNPNHTNGILKNAMQ